MHRKFIALVLVAAVAITGLSAAPAFADGKTARQFGALALLGIIALAIQDSQRKRQVVTHNYNVSPRPLPPKVTRMDLPRQCLRSHSVNGRNRNLFGVGCLNRNYGFTRSLPYACQLGFRDRGRNRIGYEPVCLRERGYRFARR